MRRYRLKDLADHTGGHILQDIVPGRYLTVGGLGFKRPGQRTHSHDGPGGSDIHTHGDCEIFVILQGKALMQVDGREHPLTTGDVMVIEPGEDHHLVADEQDPCINLWLHAGERPHQTREPGE